jgi:hypothetical protein
VHVGEGDGDCVVGVGSAEVGSDAGADVAAEVVAGAVVMSPEAVAVPVADAEALAEALAFFFLALAEADADTSDSGSADAPLPALPEAPGEALAPSLPLAAPESSCDEFVPVAPLT